MSSQVATESQKIAAEQIELNSCFFFFQILEAKKKFQWIVEGDTKSIARTYYVPHSLNSWYIFNIDKKKERKNAEITKQVIISFTFLVIIINIRRIKIIHIKKLYVAIWIWKRTTTSTTNPQYLQRKNWDAFVLVNFFSICMNGFGADVNTE